jgi:thioredoxin-related protein
MKYFIFLCLLISSIPGNTQQNDVSIPPYKRFPTLPPIQLLLGDSITRYTKENIPEKKPVLVMLFSPECSHCQHTAEEMYQHKEDLKDIQIVMATILNLTQMNDFMQRYKLNEMPNIVAGKDIFFLLPPFYDIKNFPYMAMYNKKGNLIMGFEGSMPIEKLITVFKDNK